MKLAVNYSTQSAALAAEGVIDFDLYKCTEWPEMLAIATERPAYTHFPFLAGRHDLERISPARIDEILATTATTYLNIHIAPHSAEFPHGGEAMFEAVIADINALVERYGAERVIAENVYHDPKWNLELYVAESAFINRVIEETGCGFLLDLSHATIAAGQLGLHPYDYIQSLPVHRLGEIHLTGLLYDEAKGRLTDHNPMTENEWALAAWALDHIARGDWATPWALALEYGGLGEDFVIRSRADVLAADVPRLRALMETTAVR